MAKPKRANRSSGASGGGRASTQRSATASTQGTKKTASATTGTGGIVETPALRPTSTTNASNATTGNGAKSAMSQAERVAAARQRNAAMRQAAQRRRASEGAWWRGPIPIIGSVVTVLLIIAVFVMIANNPANAFGVGDPVPTKLAQQLAGVSAQTYEKVGTGSQKNPLQVAEGQPAVWTGKDGKPVILYVGADYCPYCAAERWSIVTALSRFGTFNGLHLMKSSSTDVYPNTPTLSFDGSTYTSKYITFQAVEMQDRNGKDQQKLTAEQQQVFDTYDAPPYIEAQYKGSIPFISIANQYIQISSGFVPDQINSMTWQDIGNALNDPSNPVAQQIIGNANYLTAAICQTTKNQPGDVCNSQTIQTIQQQIAKGK